MLRAFGGVVAGYIAMAIFVAVVFIGLFLALGVERAFQPDSYEVSTLWLTISTVISFAGAILGGYVCAAIGKTMRACKSLAAIVVVLGLLLCLPAMKRGSNGPNVRAGGIPDLETMHLGVAPIWAHLLTPVLGAVGVLLGARMKKLPAV
jgi:ABC-type antimicrobial peptide transport system permease subunit